MVEQIGTGKRIGILTSGGDAQGMNAAVRAVVRTAITLGAEVYAIYEGYQGMIDGGDGIRRFGWDDVGNIMHRGGTVIGTVRLHGLPGAATDAGSAARNLLERGIDRLVVIGGDGSLSRCGRCSAPNGRNCWPNWSRPAKSTPTTADAHPALMIAGLVGSIDNDLVGTDMTIGADTALHRIVAAHRRPGQHRGQPPAQLRGRGDGPALRLPGADGGRRRRLRLRVDPGEPAGPGLGGPDVRRARAGGRGPAAGTASSWSPRGPPTGTATRSRPSRCAA